MTTEKQKRTPSALARARTLVERVSVDLRLTHDAVRAANLPYAYLARVQRARLKINLETAHDSYGAWREGTHDDLVLAVALALWTAQQGVDRTVHIFRRG